MRIPGPVHSMYKNERDYESAVEALDRFMGERAEVPSEDAADHLKGVVGYACRSHLVEIAMRDRRFMMNGDETVKRRIIKDVRPPETLWFGTVLGMVDSFVRNGASSKTKGYIKVHGTPGAALIHARRYKMRGRMAAVKVDAEAMVADGKRFTMYEDGVYCVRSIEPGYFVRLDGGPVIEMESPY